MSWQGSASPAECLYLRTAAMGMLHAAETGFNEGHSAAAMLSANPAIRVVSFEIAEHYDLQMAKYRIDAAFPGRHRLIPGDSREMMKVRWTDTPYDLMFIDGGHDYETVAADLANSLAVLRPGGLIVIDDLTPWKPWGAGPVRAWREFCGSGAVVQVDLRRDGEPIGEIPVSGGPGERVWAAGHVPVS